MLVLVPFRCSELAELIAATCAKAYSVRLHRLIGMNPVYLDKKQKCLPFNSLGGESITRINLWQDKITYDNS